MPIDVYDDMEVGIDETTRAHGGQWQLVDPLIPRSTARTGRPSSDRRLMLDGTFWILSTGAPWRDLPDRFGPWQTVYDHFRKWRRSGVFARIVEALQVKLDQQGLIDWDL